MQKLPQKLSSAVLVTSAVLLMAGCGATTDTTVTANTNTTSNTNATANVNASAKVKDDAFGLDYPASTTTAKAKEIILAPSRSFVDDSIAQNGDSTFIFYNATMGTPGATASMIDTTFDKGVSMPNALIVPIPAGQTAQVGDVVLTWWQSGSGMQRAIVVAGGTPTQPMVRYLDLDADRAAEQLKADTFYVLASEYQVGSTVAYPDDYGTYKLGQIIHETDGKLLLVGFAGSLVIVDRTDAVALPIHPAYTVGSKVNVEHIGSFEMGTVTAMDTTNGRVSVEIEFAGRKEILAAPFGNVTAAEAFNVQ